LSNISKYNHKSRRGIINISFTKIVAISALIITSIGSNATVITGGLSHDETGIGLITGSNGKTYIGWGEEGIKGNLLEMQAATQEGGQFEGYHIARRAEAAEFIELATGLNLASGYGYERGYESFPDKESSFKFGVRTETSRTDGRSSGGVEVPLLTDFIDYRLKLSFLVDDLSWNSYGSMYLSGHQASGPEWDSGSYLFPSYYKSSVLVTTSMNRHHTLGGVERDFSQNLFDSTWLLVSGEGKRAVLVPEPATSFLLCLSLLGFGLSRKRKKA